MKIQIPHFLGLPPLIQIPCKPFVCRGSDKRQSGGEGGRTPVLDTVDASISMFRRRLAVSPVGRSAPASHFAINLFVSRPARLTRRTSAYYAEIVILSRRRESDLGADTRQPWRIRS